MENAILTTLPIIFLQRTTDLSLRFPKKRKREIINFLGGKFFFLKLCFCTCRIHLWPPREKFVVKTLKIFCSKSGKDEKLMRFPNKIIFPQNVRLNMHDEILASLPLLCCQKTKNFPELQKCCSYNFLNKFIFFIKNDSFATENAILTTVANNFLWESTHLQLRFRKPQKNSEFFERKITFLKMFLCTCIKVVVTTLPKYSRQNSENFLLEFWKWGKINKPSKKFLCKKLRLNMYNGFLTSLP